MLMLLLRCVCISLSPPPLSLYAQDGPPAPTTDFDSMLANLGKAACNLQILCFVVVLSLLHTLTYSQTLTHSLGVVVGR
jgi:hypothetical protein